MLWTIIALIILMFAIFLWAAKTGQFGDIGRLMHRMMDNES